MTHNCGAEVVSVESGQGLRFGGRWVGDDETLAEAGGNRRLREGLLMRCAGDTRRFSAR